MLEAYRVVDLSDERGLMCSSLLADLGAEVIHVEPPGGSAARAAQPAGALWEAWARNTLSATVDMTSAEDLEKLRQLIRSADFLIESGEPGWLAPYGLDYETVEQLNPSIVYVSITPFGTTGPRALDPATDLTVQAASGYLFMVGRPDRAPLRVPGNHAWAHAGAEAAGAALIAHHIRRKTGIGQHVDVSAQEAMGLAGSGQSFAHMVNAPVTTRDGDKSGFGVATTPTIFKAADGYIITSFVFGPFFGPYARKMMEWVYEEGECDAETRDKDWIGYGELIASGEEPFSELDRVVEILARFFEKRTVKALFDEARARKIFLAPASSLAQVLEDEQMLDRGYFWRAKDLPEAPLVPGAIAKFSGSSLEYRGRAPKPGEHSDQLGAPTRTPAKWGSDPLPERALEGLKILDFSWLMAGPWSTRVLADYGATIVKAEGPKRPDPMRSSPPMRDGVASDANSSFFHTIAAGKLSLGLDLTTEAGRDVALDLVKWADVVVESFSPKAMKGWGLDYENLREVKPDIIMLSSSLFGQKGPNSMLPGIGTMGSALAGISAMTGWPDDKPVGPWGAYTDATAPRLAVIALLAAVDHRDATGEGQHIDMSQVETGVQWIGPELLDYVLNGRDFSLLGNGHQVMAPHGVYPSAGTEKWLAIAIRDDRDWRALCESIGQEELADDPLYCDAEARRANAESLDAIISSWTEKFTPHEAERLLVGRGVPASAVLDPYDFADEAQFRHRGHVVTPEDGGANPVPFESTHTILSRTPASVKWGGPSLGRHTDYVLSSILGYDDEKIAELHSGGVVAG